MSFSKRKFVKSISKLVFILLAIFIIILISFYFSFKDANKIGTIVIFLLGYYCYPLINKFVNWIDKIYLGPTINKNKQEMRSARKGFGGENVVNAWLEEIIGKENFFKNISFNDCDYDIDNVVVCNKGVIAVEVKNLTDPIYFEDENFYYVKEGKKLPSVYEDPRREAKRHHRALRNYIDGFGLRQVKINSILIFANGQVDWNGRTGVFIAKDKETLKRYIDGLEIDNACTPETCEKLKALLRKQS